MMQLTIETSVRMPTEFWVPYQLFTMWISTVPHWKSHRIANTINCLLYDGVNWSFFASIMKFLENWGKDYNQFLVSSQYEHDTYCDYKSEFQSGKEKHQDQQTNWEEPWKNKFNKTPQSECKRPEGYQRFVDPAWQTWTRNFNSSSDKGKVETRKQSDVVYKKKWMMKTTMKTTNNRTRSSKH